MPETLAGRLFAGLAHGDNDHRDWLKEGIDAVLAGNPVPPPRGSGNKDARIVELETTLKIARAGLKTAEDALLHIASSGLPPQSSTLSSIRSALRAITKVRLPSAKSN